MVFYLKAECKGSELAHFNRIQALSEGARRFSLTQLRKQTFTRVVLKCIGAALGADRLTSHGLGLELECVGLRITLEGLCLELSPNLIEKPKIGLCC